MPDHFNKQLGERIKALREENDLSQEKVAEFLDINRVSLSQIENGERKISAEELSKLAKILNVPTDSLLNLKTQIKVELQKGTVIPKASLKDQDIRISVPQKNITKFKEVLIYILNKVGSRANVGETVIYKLLYFIDFDFYEKYEEQLVGATYIKNNFGPTPVEFKKIVDSMQGKDLVRIQDQYFQYPQRKYLPLREADLSQLKANELLMIDEVLERLSFMSANEISNYSHHDVPWLTTQMGEVIDYESVFYRTRPYSVRSYSEEVQ